MTRACTEFIRNKKKEFDHSMDVKAIDNNLYNKNEYIHVYIYYIM
jgi:hypothetical protein